jgi:hypothetical protein
MLADVAIKEPAISAVASSTYLEVFFAEFAVFYYTASNSSVGFHCSKEIFNKWRISSVGSVAINSFEVPIVIGVAQSTFGYVCLTIYAIDVLTAFNKTAGKVRTFVVFHNWRY